VNGEGGGIYWKKRGKGGVKRGGRWRKEGVEDEREKGEGWWKKESNLKWEGGKEEECGSGVINR